MPRARRRTGGQGRRRGGRESGQAESRHAIRCPLPWRANFGDLRGGQNFRSRHRSRQIATARTRGVRRTRQDKQNFRDHHFLTPIRQLPTPMLSSHELLGFMSPALANDILSFIFESDKPAYKATLAARSEEHTSEFQSR